MRRLISSLSALALGFNLMAPAFADNFTTDQKKELENLIHSYLVEHPEVLSEVAAALDAKEKKTAEDQRGVFLGHALNSR